MPFSFKNKNYNPDNDKREFPVAPMGRYTLEIASATDEKNGNPLITKNGDPYVSVRLKIADGTHKGVSIFHNVTFLPEGNPGYGMAIKWLKEIGEPWEGEFEVMPEQWIGNKVEAMVKVVKDFKGNDKNEIAWLISEEVKGPKDDTPF